ncbi:MAG: formate dehydrogenase accessory sulfurtransferase FdhD [Deltaproteobacteria bacterium]|nr:MAG: formate dehydrogenase accessory sulfurtransferase FdhD [Deltaproteobacteria bacterium]
MKLKVLHCSKEGRVEREEEIIEEVPLLVSLNGRRYCTLFRTPGEDEALLVGMCFTEGLIRERDEILSIDLRENLADVKVAARQEKEGEDTEDIIEAIAKRAAALPKPEGKVGVGQLVECIKVMESSQEFRRRTEASHGAMIFSLDLEPISAAEDVGRHNAFDKAIGKALLRGRLRDAFIAALSSRISFEMAKKAAMAGIRVIVGISKPTSMAILLGERAGMTITSLAGGKEILVYSGRERISDCTR